MCVACPPCVVGPASLWPAEEVETPQRHIFVVVLATYGEGENRSPQSSLSRVCCDGEESDVLSQSLPREDVYRDLRSPTGYDREGIFVVRTVFFIEKKKISFSGGVEPSVSRERFLALPPLRLFKVLRFVIFRG